MLPVVAGGDPKKTRRKAPSALESEQQFNHAAAEGIEQVFGDAEESIYLTRSLACPIGIAKPRVGHIIVPIRKIVQFGLFWLDSRSNSSEGFSDSNLTARLPLMRFGLLSRQLP